MQGYFRKTVWLIAMPLTALVLTLGAALAHEGRPVGDYHFVVGWLVEPAYEGSDNAVSIRVSKIVDHQGHHEAPSMSQEEKEEGEGEGHHDEHGESNGGEDGDSNSSNRVAPSGVIDPMVGMSGQNHEQTEPVAGLEETLRVEVTHVPSGATTTRDVLAVFGDPGHYVAAMIPTATGVYEFRVFGTIEGKQIDETFVSKGGGGGFDDIRSSANLQFPVQLPELREIEGGARGALTAAQEAQDTALAAHNAAMEAQSGRNALAIVALVVGIVGVVLGAGGIYFGLRRRQG